MTLDISPQTEARLAAKAQESGLSIEALIERLISDDSDLKTDAVNGNNAQVPVRRLGSHGSYHRRDIYDDVP